MPSSNPVTLIDPPNASTGEAKIVNAPETPNQVMYDEVAQIKTFDEVFDVDAINHLLNGNGLNAQFDIDTSSLGILCKMAENHPALYKEYYERVPFDFEWEKIFDVGLPVSPKRIIEHFLEALLDIVESSGEVKFDLVTFIAGYDSVCSLNIDPIVPLACLLISCPTQEMFVADVMESLQYDEATKRRLDMSGLEGLHEGNLSLRRLCIEGRCNLDANGQVSLNEFSYGKLWPKDGFRFINKRWVWVDADRQNCHYPHGLVNVFVSDLENKTLKIDLTEIGRLRDILWRVLHYLGKRIVVLGSESEAKLAMIVDQPYLEHCYLSLGKIEGNLFIYGLDISKTTDNHIWRIIDGNQKLDAIYIAVDVRDRNFMKHIKERLPNQTNVVPFDRELLRMRKIGQ